MVSLLYFFPIKLGQFQPFEAMHKPVASPGFGFGGKKIVSVNRSRNSINRSHVGLQPVATDHFGTRTKKRPVSTGRVPRWTGRIQPVDRFLLTTLGWAMLACLHELLYWVWTSGFFIKPILYLLFYIHFYLRCIWMSYENKYLHCVLHRLEVQISNLEWCYKWKWDCW